MDFSKLPLEIQFQYLLNVSYRNILKYCSTSVNTSKICESDYFWNMKSVKDFNIYTSFIEDKLLTSRQKYEKIMDLYYNNPYSLILLLIKNHNLTAVSDLISRVGFYENSSTEELQLNGFIVEMLEEAIAAKSYDTLKGLIEILKPVFDKYKNNRGYLDDYLRNAYFDAIIMNRLDMANLIAEYYDWKEDNSEYLRSWFSHLVEEDSEDIIKSLANAGINI